MGEVAVFEAGAVDCVGVYVVFGRAEEVDSVAEFDVELGELCRVELGVRAPGQLVLLRHGRTPAYAVSEMRLDALPFCLARLGVVSDSDFKESKLR